jgi:hypothetical protein
MIDPLTDSLCLRYELMVLPAQALMSPTLGPRSGIAFRSLSAAGEFVLLID